jgi:hypothetical protein
MIDVDEVYKVPVSANKVSSNFKIKNMSFKSFFSQNTDKYDECDNNFAHRNKKSNALEKPISLCDVTNRHYEMRYRHINQLLIRGDNIVMVTYAD